PRRRVDVAMADEDEVHGSPLSDRQRLAFFATLAGWGREGKVGPQGGPRSGSRQKSKRCSAPGNNFSRRASLGMGFEADLSWAFDFLPSAFAAARRNPSGSIIAA